MTNNRYCPYCGIKLLPVKTAPNNRKAAQCHTCDCVFHLCENGDRLERILGTPPLEPELNELIELAGHKLKAVKPHINSCRYCWCMSAPGFKGFCKQIKCGWEQREDRQPIILQEAT